MASGAAYATKRRRKLIVGLVPPESSSYRHGPFGKVIVVFGNGQELLARFEKQGCLSSEPQFLCAFTVLRC
jgi:hypothetical protein